MPYIKPESRDNFDLNMLHENFMQHVHSAGDLNYLITKICHMYMIWQGENYQHYNDVLGVLEGAKLELYRRRIALYEDKKIEQNGDV